MFQRHVRSVARTQPVAVALILGAWTTFATAQVPPPPPPTPPVQQPVDDGRLTESMAQEVRRLADDIGTDLGQTALGRTAAEDARELAQGLDEFRQNRRANADPIAARQSYSALQAGWESLRAQLLAKSVATPVIARDLDRIAAVSDQLSRALGMNALPQGYYAVAGANAAPATGQTRRLAHALVDRAEGLALAIQTELGRDPNAAGLVADARSLAREADAWHDSLRADTAPAVAARSFGPVDALADRVEKVVVGGSMPPRVTAAWQAFAAAEVLLHRDLGMDVPQPTVTVPVPGVVVNTPGSPTLAAVADQLVQQTTDFVNVFGPTAGAVPQGQILLADAQRLAAASAAFRENVARNANANTLALNFRDVDAVWQRLARRVNRIAKGRTGPNIQQVSKIGATCDIIHQALGMPGYPPILTLQ